jgi:hypothetical protein
MRVKYKQGVAAPKQQESRAKMLAKPEKSRKTRDVTHAGFFFYSIKVTEVPIMRLLYR